MTDETHRRKARRAATAVTPVLISCLLAGATTAEAAELPTPLVLQSEYTQWRTSLPKDYPQSADYRRVLLRWVNGADSLAGASGSCVWYPISCELRNVFLETHAQGVK